MENVKPLWNISITKSPSYSVSTDILPFERNTTVTILQNPALPLPTPVRGLRYQS